MTYLHPRYASADGLSILAQYGDGGSALLDPSSPEWPVISALPNIAPYVPPYCERCAAIRLLRNTLLAESDWTQVPDATADAVAWAVYRQALRDVPQRPGFPDAVNWPAPPTT